MFLGLFFRRLLGFFGTDQFDDFPVFVDDGDFAADRGHALLLLFEELDAGVDFILARVGRAVGFADQAVDVWSEQDVGGYDDDEP